MEWKCGKRTLSLIYGKGFMDLIAFCCGLMELLKRYPGLFIPLLSGEIVKFKILGIRD